ncbi:hypothetical protein ABIF33_008397 [Bradyrhizobium elkanii]|uniref:hypothetical protein n=1 Tax=Bradyrhizobium elkanii TaxID=29448 RepID=UPI003513D6FD
MDEQAAETAVRTYLTEIRTRIDKAAGIARRSGSEERGDQDGESVSRRDDDRRDDCRAQEFCLL